MVLETAVQQILALIAQHGVIAVMAGMVIEEVIVPIPSPVIPMAAGFMLINATTIPAALVQVLFMIALPASIASVVSSYFVYGIAYFGGKPVLEKYGRYIDVSWEEVRHLEGYFDSGKEKYYVAGFRAVPIVPLSLISGSAGLFRMDWKTYGIWSFIGMMPRNFVLGFIGWYVKDDFMALASKIDTVSTAIAVAVAGIIAAWVIYRNVKDLYRKFLIEDSVL
ncbi:MAG: DedA family protein [Candidatus Nanohaloarchaea archaeon]